MTFARRKALERMAKCLRFEMNHGGLAEVAGMSDRETAAYRAAIEGTAASMLRRAEAMSLVRQPDPPPPATDEADGAAGSGPETDGGA